MTDAILVLNAGSSSLKFAIYPDRGFPPAALLRGKISGIGSNPVFAAKDAAGRAMPGDGFAPFQRDTGLDAVVPSLLDWLKTRHGGITIRAAGHRVVHGGRDHAGPALVTGALLRDLQTLVPLAPLHQPHNLKAIQCVATSNPGVPQVACFDTGFHRTQDRLAQLFALPRDMSDNGILRYGFHGLSYEFIASQLPAHLGERAAGRVIVAHLGSGASMCAMKNRRSVATSMGFTALDGLMMATRCGALDPGVILYLAQEKGLTAAEIATLLYKKSGLLGVSDFSNDMVALQASPLAAAQEAIDLFCYRAAGELSRLATAVGGLDAVIFTAGIGENSAPVRAGICARLRWLGVAIDAEANDINATRIGSPHSDVEVLIIPTDEEATIATSTLLLTHPPATQSQKDGGAGT